MNIYEHLINKEDLSPYQKMALDNCIGIFITGSHLYGTNIPSSDTDYEGIFIEPPEYVLGSKSCDEVNFSTGDPDTRNTSEDIDCKLYSLRKFFQLAKNNNPNKIEYFFVPKDKMVYVNDEVWNKILENKDIFISLKIKHSFSGYAKSQEKKLLTKKKRYDELKSFKKFLESSIYLQCKTIKDLFEKTDILEVTEHKKYHKETDSIGIHKVKRVRGNYEHISYKMTEEANDSLVVDNKEYNLGMLVSTIYDYITKEVEKYGQRTKYIQEYGFDLKFASHLFRLYYEGLSLLNTGILTFPMPEDQRDLMLGIKKGYYDLNYILEESKKLEPIFEEAYRSNKANLRYSPDQEAIDKLQVNLIFDFWRRRNLIK